MFSILNRQQQKVMTDIQKGIEEQIENSKVSIVISDGLL